jgi:hypothetical protein
VYGSGQPRPASARPHAGNGSAHELPRRPEVHLQTQLEPLRRHRLERHVAVHGGVVDQDVDGAERGLGSLDQRPAAAVRIGEIRRQHEALTADRLDAPARRPEALDAARRDRHLGALRGEAHRDRGAGAPLAGAGHQRDSSAALALRHHAVHVDLGEGSGTHHATDRRS